jgi:signal transduction histidine kinase
VNEAAATLFGSAREDLIGTLFGFPMAAGETTELDLVRAGETYLAEMRVVETEWEGAPACIASLRDITERKRAEEAARRLIREQTARTAAEQAARRFRFLAESSTVLSSSLDYRNTLSALARLCVSRIADWAVIYVTDDAGGVRRLEVAHRDPKLDDAVRELRELPIDPAGRHPVLEVIRTASPTLVRTVDQAHLEAITESEEHRDLTRRLGIASFMLVPLLAHDRCLGAISLVRTDPDVPYNDDDLALAQDLALRAALAVDNARLYHAAQDANRSKTDLLAVISHDLRTPLNAIMGHAELLELGIPEPLSDATLERVGRIRVSARHLLYLIDELLSFVRLEAGREQVRLQDIDARTLAQDVASVVEPLALQRNLRFVLDVAANPIPVHTDPDKLRQVLLNLTANAVKYTRMGEIRLEVADAGDAAVIFRTRDTGIGIHAEHLQQIFEPFWQADGGHRNIENGTGLGLSVVQRIVRLLGGTVAVESEPDVGSTFTVTLPRRPLCANPEAGVFSPATTPAGPSLHDTRPERPLNN